MQSDSSLASERSGASADTSSLLSPLRAAVLAICILWSPTAIHAAPPTILVFSKTAGFRHTSIEPGIEAITTLGERNGFGVVATEDSDAFTAEKLQRYAAVVFLSTTGNVLNAEQQRALETYVENGGGFVGVHSAADTEYEWPWYEKLVGAWFDSHGAIQDAAVLTAQPFGQAALPKPWVRRDEWYNFKRLPQHVRVILKLDTSSFRDSKHAGNHPIAWHHEIGRGRAFYTGLGHTDESYSEPLFLAHLLDGIRYALGKAASAHPSSPVQRERRGEGHAKAAPES